MGAGSTSASLVSFHSGNDPKQGIKNLVDLDIVAFQVDESLSGNELDRRLQRYMAQEFQKIHFDIMGDERAMAKLLREANRCKTILSANQLVFASVEGLSDGVDMKMKITREKLEELASDLFEKVTEPIKSVLEQSGVSLDQIKSMVLFGGSVRVPAFQKLLEDYVGQDKIARNVDGDEAAVFGAVLHAASTSGQYRLGQMVRLKEINSLPIKIWYNSDATSKKIETILFNNVTAFGSKKMMTFKKTDDFKFGIDYEMGTGVKRIVDIEVGGLKEAVLKYKDSSIGDPKVKVQINLNESGILEVTNAIASFDIDKGKKSLADSVLNYFNGSKEDKNGNGEKIEEVKEKSEENESEKNEVFIYLI
jgi:hypoxia up-regulated 1